VAPAEDWSYVTRRPKKIQEIEVVFHCRGNFYCGENSVLSCLDNVTDMFSFCITQIQILPLSSPLIPAHPCLIPSVLFVFIHKFSQSVGPETDGAVKLSGFSCA
jgi:hypothetical protein